MTEPKEERPKLELSPIKVAAGAAAAATATAIGSTLGVAGTIAGAAVASVVSASASALFSHSLERGKDAAKKALPLTLHEADPAEVQAAHGLRRLTSPGYPHVDVPPLNASTALDETVLLDRGALPGPRSDPNDATTVLPAAAARDAETVLLPRIPGASGASGAGGSGGDVGPQKWTDRLPRWKTMAAVGAVTFVIGIGSVAALNLAKSNDKLLGPVTKSNQNNTSQVPNPGKSPHDSPPTDKHTTPTPTPSGSETPTPAPTPSGSPTTPTTPPTTDPTTNPTTPTTPPSSQSTPTGPASTPASGAASAPVQKSAPPATTTA